MARKPDPLEVVHVQPKPGATVLYNGIAYGERSTLQVQRRDLDRLDGEYDVLDSGADVPDVGDISPAA
jgi:hypothetical protein